MAQIHNIGAVLAGLRGVSFLGLDMETVVPLKGGRKNAMQGRVTKRVTGSTVLVAQNKNTNTYENMVRNRIVGGLLNEFTAKLDRAAAATELLQNVLDEAAMTALSQQIEQQLNETDQDRRNVAEERFNVQPRKWGQRVSNTPFIEHVKKGDIAPTYYLDTIFLRSGRVEFFLDGQPILEQDIEGYEKPQAKEGANIQGGLAVDQQLAVRSIGLDSILAIRSGGQEFRGQFVY